MPTEGYVLNLPGTARGDVDLGDDFDRLPTLDALTVTATRTSRPASDRHGCHGGG
jgi:hypothetical protein